MADGTFTARVRLGVDQAPEIGKISSFPHVISEGVPHPDGLGPEGTLAIHLTKFPTLPVIFSIYLKTNFLDFFEIL